MTGGDKYAISALQEVRNSPPCPCPCKNIQPLYSTHIDKYVEAPSIWLETLLVETMRQTCVLDEVRSGRMQCGRMLEILTQENYAVFTAGLWGRCGQL